MMKKWFAAVLAAGVLLTGSVLTASAAEVTLYDYCRIMLYNDERYDTCKARLQKAADEIGMDISLYFYDGKVEDGELLYIYADDYYTEPVYDGSDAVVCYVHRSDETAEIIFNTGGIAGMYYLDDARLNMIKDNLRYHMYGKDTSDPVTATEVFATDLEYWYNEGAIEGMAIYDNVNDVYYYEEDGEVMISDEPLSADDGDDANINEEDEPETDDESEKGLPQTDEKGVALIYEEQKFLSGDEYDYCLALLQDAADKTGMNVGLVLGAQVRSEYTIRSLADSSYDTMFGKNTDGLLYYMNLSGAYSPYDYISTSGLGQFYYTNSEKVDRINAIFDRVFPYLTPAGSEDVPGAVEMLAQEIVYYYEEGVPDRYYVYDDVYEQYMYLEDGKIVMSSTLPLSHVDLSAIIAKLVMLAFFGIGAGLIVAVIVFFCVKSHYKFKVSLSPTAYINRKNLVIHRQHDNFIRTYTTRVKIESSSGGGRSGGSRGGGRSSGGHGGGGRHR
ncbi:MAG: hypothetical protein IKL00_02155 [Oscillospiraceae bacterium]|nr:hypothetical protein [Oscillospiraceae bacterium]